MKKLISEYKRANPHGAELVLYVVMCCIVKVNVESISQLHVLLVGAEVGRDVEDEESNGSHGDSKLDKGISDISNER